MPNAPDAPMSADETMQELSAWVGKAISKVEERLNRKKKKSRQSDSEEEFPPLMLRWADPGGDEKDVHALDQEELQGLGGSLAIAQKLYAIASRDASSLGDKQAYFVSIDGFPGRFPLVFDDGMGDDMGDDELPDGDGEDDDEPHGPIPSRFGPPGMSPNGGAPGRIPVYDYVEWAKNRHTHEQMLMKDGRMLVQEVLRTQRQVITELSETVRNQDKTHVQLRIALEEMLDRKHQRDLEMRRLGHSEERKEKAIQMLEPFGRAIAVKLMGPAAAQGENGQSLFGLLSSVFDSFDEDQLKKMLMTGDVHLSPMQRQHLAELFVTMKNMEQPKAPSPNGVNGVNVSHQKHAHVDGGHQEEERKER